MCKEIEASRKELQKREEAIADLGKRVQQLLINYDETMEPIKERILQMKRYMNQIVAINDQMVGRIRELEALNGIKDKLISIHLNMGCSFFLSPDEGDDHETSDCLDLDR